MDMISRLVLHARTLAWSSRLDLFRPMPEASTLGPWNPPPWSSRLDWV